MGLYCTSKLSFVLILSFICSLNLCSQEILISKDISIRNYFSYSIIGKVNDRIIMYRDQGFVKNVDVFDLTMQHKFKGELILEDKKALVHELIGRDSLFQTVYSYSIRDTVINCIRNYDERLQLLDSTVVSKYVKADIKSKIRSIVSENNEKLVLFYTDREKNIDVSCIDLINMTLEWNEKFSIAELDVVADFLTANFSDDGHLFMLFDRNKSSFKKDKHQTKLLVVHTGNGHLVDLDFDENLTVDLILECDNLNNRIVIAGLYNKKADHRVDGIYMFNEAYRSLNENKKIKFFPFNESFVSEVSSNRKNNKKQLENFGLNNLVLRNDGGVLLFAEMNKTYNRRNPYNGVFSATTDSYNRRGWTDYYNEDVIVMAFDNEYNLDWKTVLYKKQFSQDDEGAYSSYFLFKTSSRIRMLYNDEIKKNNTVSEYLLDPLGNQIRSSLLSTDYQNLKLRFTGAVQVASNIIIVPSETSFNVNLVKIEY